MYPRNEAIIPPIDRVDETSLFLRALSAGYAVYKTASDLLIQWNTEESPELKEKHKQALELFVKEHGTLNLKNQKNRQFLMREFARSNQTKIVKLMLALSPEHENNYLDVVRGCIDAGNPSLAKEYARFLNPDKQMDAYAHSEKDFLYVSSLLHRCTLPAKTLQRTMVLFANANNDEGLAQFKLIGSTKQLQVTLDARARRIKQIYKKAEEDSDLIETAVEELASINRQDKVWNLLAKTGYSKNLVERAIVGFMKCVQYKAVVKCIEIIKSKGLSTLIIPFILKSLLQFELIPEFVALFTAVYPQHADQQLGEHKNIIVYRLAMYNRLDLIEKFRLANDAYSHVKMIYGAARSGRSKQVSELMLRCQAYYRRNHRSLKDVDVAYAVKGYMEEGYIIPAILLLNSRIDSVFELDIFKLNFVRTAVNMLKTTQYVENDELLLLTLTSLHNTLYESRANCELKRETYSDLVASLFSVILKKALREKYMNSKTKKEIVAKFDATYERARLISRFICEYDLSYLQAKAVLQNLRSIMTMVYWKDGVIPQDILQNNIFKELTGLHRDEVADLFRKLWLHRAEKKLIIDLCKLESKTANKLVAEIALCQHQPDQISAVLFPSDHEHKKQVTAVVSKYIRFFRPKMPEAAASKPAPSKQPSLRTSK